MAVALAVVVPVLVIDATPEPRSDAWIGPLFIAIIAGIQYAYVAASASRRPFELMFWLFFYAFLGLAPIVQIRTGLTPATTPGINASHIGQASTIVIAAELAFIVGGALMRKPSEVPSKSVFLPHVDLRRVRILTFAALVIAAGYIAMIGPSTLFSARTLLSNARSDLFGGTIVGTIATSIVSMGVLVALLGQILIWKERKRAGQKRPQLMIWITAVALFTCVNPISSPRFVFGTVFLAVLAALGLFATVRRFRLLSIITPVGLLVVFPQLDAFRRDTANVKLEESGLVPTLTHGDFDSFPQIVNAVHYVAVDGHSFGQQIGGALLFWVPRSIWPSKPVDSGILLGEFRGYGFTNLSAPLVAEFFLDGGWLLLLPGMALLGWWLRRWDGVTDLVIARWGVPSIIAMIVPFYSLLVLRGSLLQAMSYFAVIVACAWFVRSRTSSGPEDVSTPTKSAMQVK